MPRKLTAEELKGVSSLSGPAPPEGGVPFYCIVCKKFCEGPARAGADIGGWCCVWHTDEQVRFATMAPSLPVVPSVLEALERLERFGTCVLADIGDQDTGWFYQFQAALQGARVVIRRAKKHGVLYGVPPDRDVAVEEDSCNRDEPRWASSKHVRK